MKFSVLSGVGYALGAFLLVACSVQPNATVEGLSTVDSDQDGIVQSLDRCPETSPGVAVDSDGCPEDSDGDGVFNALDRCPGTAVDQAVDVYGCNSDQDGDGVFDMHDRCAGSVQGEPVDLNGCSTESLSAIKPVMKPAEEVKELVQRNLVIYFEFDRADLLPEFRSLLAAMMSGLNPGEIERIEIVGHTDSRGRDSYNLELSRLRAESVSCFLATMAPRCAGHVVLDSRGELDPVADNNTAQGRQLNRRVEIRVLISETAQMAGS